ncbi:hypothetical protein Tco_0414520 [Tanacetum coccineum]
MRMSAEYSDPTQPRNHSCEYLLDDVLAVGMSIEGILSTTLLRRRARYVTLSVRDSSLLVGVLCSVSLTLHSRAKKNSDVWCSRVVCKNVEEDIRDRVRAEIEGMEVMRETLAYEPRGDGSSQAQMILLFSISCVPPGPARKSSLRNVNTLEDHW